MEQRQAYIANFIENGTKFPMYTAKGRKYKHGGQVAINGDHAIDNLRNDSQLQAKIVEAQAEVYKQIVELTGRARPCSTCKNTQKSRRFKLKSGF
ncbi:hypothetical protein H7R52_06985 [Weissella confusa]|uniref:Uncharacterized protein n=1 Tax=Weissella confusa TaxID=1583 RepID=A0A923NGU7_WEICO|nr:hypothetical protein [Weissella confusa]